MDEADVGCPYPAAELGKALMVRRAALLVIVVLAVCGCSGSSPTPRVALPPAGTAYGIEASPEPFAASGQVFVSYNSGLQIGNDVLLYRAVHQARYLADANRVATQGLKTFGDLAYPLPPGNTVIFGLIYLRELQTLTPYSNTSATVYDSQRKAYLGYVKAHPAKAGGARRYPSGLWSEQGHYAYLWSLEEVVASQEDNHSYQPAPLRYYWNGRAWASGLSSKIKPYGDVYWDDNVWAALDELAAYSATRNRAYLKFAQSDFKFLQAGWTHPQGGVRWVDANWSYDITAGSTLGAEQVALELYFATGRQWDLRWAQGVQFWVDHHLRARNGLIYDHLTPCGKSLCFNVPGPAGPPSAPFYDPMLYIAASAS